jgi:hypothetical protein
LQTNTKEQGVELIKADLAVETALSDTVKANEEIVEAQVI